jgi:hypothetical protein
MKSNLYLEVYKSDLKHLTLSDKSFYNPDLEIKSPLIQVTTPGMSIPININFEANKSVSLNSYHLKLSKQNNLLDLPDGIYTIKYSICPVDVLFTEFYHYRITKLEHKYFKLLCQSLSDCDKCNKELEQLKDIRIKMVALEDAAHCLDINLANEIYNWIDNKLKTIKC